jgi:hypothetical protein
MVILREGAVARPVPRDLPGNRPTIARGANRRGRIDATSVASV